jgi:hypothetical protein
VATQETVPKGWDFAIANKKYRRVHGCFRLLIYGSIPIEHLRSCRPQQYSSCLPKFIDNSVWDYDKYLNSIKCLILPINDEKNRQCRVSRSRNHYQIVVWPRFWWRAHEAFVAWWRCSSFAEWPSNGDGIRKLQSHSQHRWTLLLIGLLYSPDRLCNHSQSLPDLAE